MKSQQPTHPHNRVPTTSGRTGLIECLRRIRIGLKAPRGSGQYRYARLQMSRAAAPICAVLLPLLLITLLAIIPTPVRDTETVATVVLEEPKESPPQLEPIPEPDPEPIDTQTPIQIDGPPMPEVQPPIAALTTQNNRFAPQPNDVSAVSKTVSPVIIRRLFSGRTTGAISDARADGGGNNDTEDAVLRALRWLKSEQSDDGSWPGSKSTTAVTGLAVLTYLAHGDLPGSAEFGTTVERGMRCLLARQQSDGAFSPRDPHDYTHPIAAYALVEAFGMTRNPQLRGPAKQAMKRIIDGQHPSGGWDYNLKQTDRDDCSYMGWCVQALKAARIADLYGRDEAMQSRLDQSLSRAAAGFRRLFVQRGEEHFFAYTTQSHHRQRNDPSLTGVGTLALQLLGHAETREAQLGTQAIASYRWEQWAETDWRRLYFRYYDTQVAFQQGGSMWKQWNPMFQRMLLENQVIEEDQIADTDGELRDVGHWTTHDNQEGLVYNTCLCALMLEVYYRHLPTYRPRRAEDDVAEGVSEDIPVIVAGINLHEV